MMTEAGFVGLSSRQSRELCSEVQKMRTAFLDSAEHHKEEADKAKGLLAKETEATPMAHPRLRPPLAWP